MIESEYFLILNAIVGLGQSRVKKLLRLFRRAEDVFRCSAKDLKALKFLPQNVIDNILHFPKDKFIRQEMELIRKNHIKIVTLNDEDYPKNLRAIPQAPCVLYVKGALRQEHFAAIAIIGSRKASFYGLSVAEKLARELGECGITVVSGMARGIDSAAHRGALNVQGQTIAVCGNGLNFVYPPENTDLFQKISRLGAVISEFPMMTQPGPCNFPRRNRIISGLSLGVVVVEATRRSGALITSDFALEQGRDVFAIPGKINSPQSVGVHNLIKQGAKLVSSKEDILEELEVPLKNYLQDKKTSEHASPKHSPVLEEEENKIVDFVGNQPCHIDDIVQGCRLLPSRTMSLLMSLEIKKKIRQLSGKRFVRVDT